MKPMIFIDDPSFWYETQRTLGHATYGGSDTGEVLATVDRITAGDYESWYREWTATAERVAGQAWSALTKGHQVSARDGLLRASNYYRCAEFFLHGNAGDPRIRETYLKSVAAFQAALPLLPYQVSAVAIPFESTVLRGYFYRAAGSGPAPVVVMHNGFDGTAEEMHFFGAAAAVERGYHALVFDGPGQPASRVHDGLVFRPDWENVVSPVLDWLLTTRAGDVDPARIALLGISMGGILAPRAAAFEPRISALITIDGLYDLGETATRDLPMSRERAERALRAPEAPELDAALERLMAEKPTLRWAISHGMYAMGTDTPRRFLAAYLDYTLAGGIAEKITASTLVCDGEEDIFFGGQAEKLYEHLTAPKTLIRFTSEEGAGAHCQSGAQRLAFGRAYDWLTETFQADPRPTV